MASEPDLEEWYPFAWMLEDGRDSFCDFDWPAKNADLRVHWGVGEWMVGYVRVDAARAWQAFRDFLNGTVEQWMEMDITPEGKR